MHRQAYVILLLTALFWGGNAVAGKLAVGHVSPMLLTSMRWTFAVLILVSIGWRQLRADWPKVRPALPLLVLLGGIGFTVFNIALYTALEHTTVINVSILQAAIPMAIFLGSFVLFRTRVTGVQMAGFALSVLGVAIVASHGDPRRLLELDLNVGDALMLVAIVVYAIYTLLLRYKPDIHWMSMMIIMCAAAFATSLPFAAYEAASGAAVWPDARGWAIVVYTVLFPSIISQVLYIRGVDLIGANRAGLFINMVPIFGTMLSLLILGEDFHAYHAIASALVLGGVALAEWSGRKIAVAGA